MERARKILLLLPYAAETLQWGEKVIFWVGDKSLGGKMFGIADLDASSRFVIAFAAGPQRTPDLLEMEGIFPAPYLARAHWVAAERWDVLSEKDWHKEFEAAHAYVFGRLPMRTRQLLTLPPVQQQRFLKERESTATKRPKRSDPSEPS